MKISIMYKNKVLNFILQKIHFLFFFILFTIVLIEHFYGITNIGIDGCDSFFYWKTAKSWYNNEFILTKHFRPLTYFIQSLSFHFFGVHDYSIKLLNAIIDIINVFLIYSLGFKIGKNHFLALISALTYGLLTQAFILSRSEMPHVISTFFLLLTVLSLQSYTTKNKLKYLVIGGLFSGILFNTHPELIILNLSFVLIILLSLSNKYIGLKTIFIKSILPATVFIASFLLIQIILGGKFGFEKFLFAFLNNGNSEFSSKAFSIFGIIKSPLYLVYWNSSLLVLILFILNFFFINKKTINLLFVILNYLLLYPIFMPSITIGRLFFPLMPLLIIVIFSFIFTLTEHTKQRNNILILFSFLIIYSSRIESKSYEPTFNTSSEMDDSFKLFLSFNQKKSPYKMIFEEMENRVNASSKILITPFIFYEAFGRQPFTNSVYFGNNAKYISKINSTLPTYTKKEKIKYILVAKKYFDNRILRKRHSANLELGYNLKIKDYQLEKDYQIIMNFIDSNNGKLILSSNFANIYKIEN